MNENEIREIVKNTIIASKSEMTLPLAERIANAVIAEAERMGIKVVVCVSDAAGNPKLVKVMEDAYIASYDIAVNKAFTVVALKMPTVKLKSLAAPGGELYGIQFTNGGKIVIFGGGDPLINPKGKIIGGLGVSGGSEAQDIALSEFGKSFFETKI
ncbi:MAG: heme-binding protein [Clostridia bacterium]|nr:heme-binding protein [Clostridia bacterium]